ncbi:HTH_Tnp_Tc3_2 domain-containing protein [Trichonephila clavipes]|nr:HTH_Tnp_Tc3_2 domain-containing protein [Trichonephila clavipes]
MNGSRGDFWCVRLNTSEMQRPLFKVASMPTKDDQYMYQMAPHTLTGIRVHYKQLSKSERDRIIELKEGGWANRKIARHMGGNDAAIRRCWLEWVDNGRFQRYDGSG